MSYYGNERQNWVWDCLNSHGVFTGECLSKREQREKDYAAAALRRELRESAAANGTVVEGRMNRALRAIKSQLNGVKPGVGLDRSDPAGI